MALTKQEKDQIIKESESALGGSSGSVEVQIALLTRRIGQLTEHLKKNKKDFSSKRGLLMLVAQRRIFLQYLKKTAVKKYFSVVEHLNLKEIK